MLETKVRPVSTTGRFSPELTPGRAVGERATARAQAAPRARTPARPAVTAPPSAPTRRSARPSAQQNRLARSEGRLLTIAIFGTAVVCCLLVLYLAAYARVALLGIDQAQSRVALHARRLEYDSLNAQYAALQDPKRIIRRAVAFGMTRYKGPVDYIHPRPSSSPAVLAAAQMDTTIAMAGRGEDSSRVADRDTTASDNSTASDPH